MPSERDRELLSPVSDTAAPKCVCTGRLGGAHRLSPVVFVNTVTRGWVGAPNERAPFSFMAQSLVLSIAVCPGLGISPLRTNISLSFSQADLGPRSAQDFFFGALEKFETFLSKICAHSERYRNILAGIIEILTFYENIAFPLSPI